MFEMPCADFQFLSSFPDTRLNFSMVLSSANLGVIGGWGNQAGQRLPYFVNPLVGVLEPGDVYTLQDSMEGSVYTGDPISEITLAQASLTLTAAPEPSSGLLVGMGVVGWLLMRLGRNSRR